MKEPFTRNWKNLLPGKGLREYEGHSLRTDRVAAYASGL
jgi:hypothetical protein